MISEALQILLVCGQVSQAGVMFSETDNLYRLGGFSLFRYQADALPHNLRRFQSVLPYQLVERCLRFFIQPRLYGSFHETECTTKRSACTTKIETLDF
ncbi:MAG: hypothetical protein WB679_04115 [Terracidiphilus sp.]